MSVNIISISTTKEQRWLMASAISYMTHHIILELTHVFPLQILTVNWRYKIAPPAIGLQPIAGVRRGTKMSGLRLRGGR